MRPPLAYPSGLKPFVRFHKLPAKALAKVREVVEADVGFQDRLKQVATAELLDEVGMLWVTRPEGWRTAAAALVASEDQPIDHATELRREQRRREAAEAAAVRSQLEASGLRDQLDADRTTRDRAQAEVARLTAELAGVRTQLRQTERAAQKRANGADAAAAKADSADIELATVRAELLAAVAARDAALADRAAAHGGGPADVERVRALLTEALALTRGTVPSARRRQRKPVPVPGGLYGNSDAAGEHLLRVADAVVLVDGYNVAKLGWPGLSLDRQRELCIEAAENLARRWGCLIHIVFDGTTIVGATASGRRLVRVSFSPEGVSADDVLRAEVAALDADRPVVVVTNDQAIITDVRAAGANLVSSDTFLALARR